MLLVQNQPEPLLRSSSTDLSEGLASPFAARKAGRNPLAAFTVQGAVSLEREGIVHPPPQSLVRVRALGKMRKKDLKEKPGNAPDSWNRVFANGLKHSLDPSPGACGTG